MANPCEWKGTRYRSQVELVRAAGTTELAVRLYIARHGTLEGFGDPPAMSEQSVRHLLACGYGVEDIADKLHVTADAVRVVVDDLRARGVLRRMWPKGDAA